MLAECQNAIVAGTEKMLTSCHASSEIPGGTLPDNDGGVNALTNGLSLPMQAVIPEGRYRHLLPARGSRRASAVGLYSRHLKD